MKKLTLSLRTVLLSVGLVLAAPLTYAQDILSAGDISFTGFDSRGNPTGAGSEWFSFVLNRGINPSTVINFTDIGYIGNSQATNPNTFTTASTSEGIISWTAGSFLPTGTEVTINNLTAYINGSTTTTNGSVIGISGSNIFTLASVDQVIAYQGALSPSATFLAALHWNRCSSGGTIVTTTTGWDPQNTATCTGNSASQVPPGLTSGGANATAIWIGDIGTNISPATYNCINNPTPYSPTNFRSSVTTNSNWIRNTSSGAVASSPTGSACGRNYYATILPVTWHSFDAVYSGGVVRVGWTVGEESNLQGYQVERSENSRDFEWVGTTIAKGTNGVYQFIDRSLGTAAQYFYRLKTLATDGTVQYSNTVRVLNEQAAATEIRLVRNPIGASLDLEIAAVTAGVASITVRDITGRQVLQQSSPIQAGRQVVTCPAAILQPNQVYLVTGAADGKAWHMRVVR